MKLEKIFSLLLSFIIILSSCSINKVKEISSPEIKKINIENKENVEIIRTGCNQEKIIQTNIEHFKIRNFHTNSFNIKTISSDDIEENVNYLIDKIENVKVLENKILSLTNRGDIAKLNEVNIQLQNAITERDNVKTNVITSLIDYKTYLRNYINSILNDPTYFNYDKTKPVNLDEYRNLIQLLNDSFYSYVSTGNTFYILESIKYLSDEVDTIVDLINDYSNNTLSDIIIDPNSEIFYELDLIYKKTEVIKYFVKQISKHQSEIPIEIDKLNNEIKEIEKEINEYEETLVFIDSVLSQVPQEILDELQNEGFSISAVHTPGDGISFGKGDIIRKGAKKLLEYLTSPSSKNEIKNATKNTINGKKSLKKGKKDLTETNSNNKVNLAPKTGSCSIDEFKKLFGGTVDNKLVDKFKKQRQKDGLPATGETVTHTTGTINNNKIDIKAFSGDNKNSPAGYAKNTKDNPYNDNHTKSNDAEIKTLGKIAEDNKNNKNVTGNITITADKFTCHTCRDSIKKFSEEFKGIVIKVISAHPEPKSKL